MLIHHIYHTSYHICWYIISYMYHISYHICWYIISYISYIISYMLIHHIIYVSYIISYMLIHHIIYIIHHIIHVDTSYHICIIYHIIHVDTSYQICIIHHIIYVDTSYHICIILHVCIIHHICWYIILYMSHTANPTWGDIFESSKLKARMFLLPRFSEKRRSSFELLASKQNSKKSPQVGSAVHPSVAHHCVVQRMHMIIQFFWLYGLATISRLLQIIGLFCRISSFL